MEDGDRTREELVGELERLRGEARRLSDAKAQAELYLDLMGHDINNMNQIAMGYLELIAERHSEDSEERVMIERPLEMLKSSSRLIDNVRKLQAVKEGGIRLEPVDMGRLLEDVKAKYEHMPGKSVAIRYTKVDGCVVMANKLIGDVFSNLILNAIKHSSGSVNITISIAPVKSRQEDSFAITVEDDGPGVPDRMKSLVFDRKWRGPTKADGVGLGLYLVHTLVEEFGGKVWIEDRVNGDHTRGSRFIVLLPAHKKKAEAVPGALAN